MASHIHAEQHASRVDAVYRALNSRPRREILRMLARADAASEVGCCGSGDLCGCEFTEVLGLSAPTVSHHLKVLADAGLVASAKRGLWVHYRLVPGALDEALAELSPVTAAVRESPNEIEPPA